MEKVALTESTMLVGRVRGRNYSLGRLKKWTVEVWGNVMEQLPAVLSMSKGWFSLIFLEPKQVNWALMCYCHLEMALILLKRWSPLFDPEKENLGARLIWVHLSRLSLQFCSEDIFRCIGDDFCTYLDHDRTYLDSGCLPMAKFSSIWIPAKDLWRAIDFKWGTLSNGRSWIMAASPSGVRGSMRLVISTNLAP